MLLLLLVLALFTCKIYHKIRIQLFQKCLRIWHTWTCAMSVFKRSASKAYSNKRKAYESEFECDNKFKPPAPSVANSAQRWDKATTIFTTHNHHLDHVYVFVMSVCLCVFCVCVRVKCQSNICARPSSQLAVCDVYDNDLRLYTNVLLCIYIRVSAFGMCEMNAYNIDNNGYENTRWNMTEYKISKFDNNQFDVFALFWW